MTAVSHESITTIAGRPDQDLGYVELELYAVDEQPDHAASRPGDLESAERRVRRVTVLRTPWATYPLLNAA